METTVCATVLALVFAGVLAPSTGQTAPYQYRTFNGTQTMWFVGPDGVLAYSVETETVRGVPLAPGVETERIHDVIEDEGSLWVLSSRGLHTLNLSTGTVQAMPFATDTLPFGKLAADIDYLWLAGEGVVWQYDKLGMEWLSFDLPGANDSSEVLGLHSDGDNLYCVGLATAWVFSIYDEKFQQYPVDAGSVGGDALALGTDEAITFYSAEGITRFLCEAKQWERVAGSEELRDFFLEDQTLYFLAGQRAVEYDYGSSFGRTLDLRGLTEYRSLSKVADKLYVLTAGALSTYDVTDQSVEALPPPPIPEGATVILSNWVGPGLLVITDKGALLYDQEMDNWRTIEIAAARGGARAWSWDEEGLQVRYDRERRTILNGTVEAYYRGLRSELRYDTSGVSISYDTTMVDDSMVVSIVRTPVLDSSNSTLFLLLPERPNVYADVTLHSDLGSNRYLDVYFDNANTSRPVEMGARYQGDRTDVLSRVEAGTVDLEHMSSPVLPDVLTRGGSATLQSRRRLEQRDRAMLRANAAGGAIVSRTLWQTLDYNAAGSYKVANPLVDSLGAIVVPGTMRLWVDGAELEQGEDFTFVAVGQQLTLMRADLVDPTSVVTVSYEIQTVPDVGLERVQVVPDRDFGNAALATARYSPTSWLSAEAGYLAVDRDDLAHTALFGAPLEFRPQDGRFFLKADPRLAVNTGSGAAAGSVGLQGRAGSRTSVEFDGVWASRSFATTDSLSRGYGALTGETDGAISFDIVKDATVGYSNYWMQSRHGSRLRHEFSGGLHFPRFPFLDVSLSRDELDVIMPPGPGDTVADTIDSRKDRLRVTLEEASSPFVEKLLHIKRLRYQLAYTEYRSTSNLSGLTDAGRSVYGSLTLVPVSSILVDGSGYYRRNPDGELNFSDMGTLLYVQTSDAPKGVDVSARHRTNFANRTSSDTSVSRIDRSLQLILKPGSWTRALGWFSPRGGVSQSVECTYPVHDPGIAELVVARTDRSANTLKGTVGVHVFPTSGLLFKNDNVWTDGDSSSAFTTTNWIQWIIGNKGRIIAQYVYGSEGGTALSHNAYALYARTWLPWLRSVERVKFSYTGSDTSSVSTIGPQVDVYLSARDVRFIRILENSHRFGLDWHIDDGVFGGTPDINYLFRLEVLIRPNITFETLNTLAFRQGAFDGYEGDFLLRILF